ncbi:DUF421 domain-containing protein [Alicyclobacillus sp. SO9]|uniref:DUF421 domain-containing protein n=1 Tax=Alicyclobacillus sp. SO9 TaxID=2665646 RepID=UPI0018E9024B|nr:DUF421 domain-containing protein [Alicyclobacillus sp. SO9]QQE80150.1 DUF421 domain-containing protein [Alicyclobacillus sp. SO9]
MPSVGEILLKSVVSFAVLFIFARWMGKRQIAQLTFFDYVAGITIGNMAASWALAEVISRTALTGLVVWTVLSSVLAMIERNSYRVRVLLDGKPTVLVEQGKLLEENLKKVQISLNEFMVLLRQKDVFDLSEVDYAVMENNGKVSVRKKPERQPVTKKDLHVPVAPEAVPQFLVIGGQIIDKTLQQLGYSRKWLQTELEKQGVADPSDVFAAQLDSKGVLYLDMYKDLTVHPQVQAKPLLLASLKKAEADLEMYSLQTEDREARGLYESLARETQDIIRRMTPFLQS